MRWQQGATIARSQLFQSHAAVTAQRLIIGNPLGEQQALDTIDMCYAFGRQRLALPADPAAVFFLSGWGLDHGAHSRFPALVGQKRTHQRLTVDLVGLRASPSA